MRDDISTKTVSELVRETIDFIDRGFYEQAFVEALQAIIETAKKAYKKEDLSDDDQRQFVRENWALISFMGMPGAAPLSMNIRAEFKRIIPAFNAHHGVEELITYVAGQTLLHNKLPGAISFNIQNTFEVKNRQILLPTAIIFGLIGSVIFHPVNKDETISDKYWFSVSDFKMFISEFWGRRDLAERIMKFYLER